MTSAVHAGPDGSEHPVQQDTACLAISIEPSSGLPAHRQISEQIRGLIESGRLRVGARLPSSRRLAAELGVSRMTTQTALDHLLAEGYLVSAPRRGLFVAEHLPLSASLVEADRPVPESVGNGAEHGWRFESGASVADFPNQSWRRALRRSWLNPSRELMEGARPGGYPPLRAAIADLVYSLRGLRCSPEQILVTAGNRDALTLVLNTLRRLYPERSSMWLENPCYPLVLNSLRGLGFDPSPLMVDGDGARLPGPSTGSGDSQSPLAALVTPARQYPLGRMMSTRRRQQWLDYLSRQSREKTPLWLIEDDYDSEFIYEGQAQAPLSASDESGRCILLGSFSKSVFRSLRLGYIVAPPALVDALLATQQQLGQAAALPLQPVLHHFIDSGDFSGHLRRMRRLYLSRRDALVTLLEQADLPLTPWPCRSGMHLIAELNPDCPMDDNEWARRAGAVDLKLDTLARHFWAGEPYCRGFLLGFTARGEDYLQQAVQRLAQSQRLKQTG